MNRTAILSIAAGTLALVAGVGAAPQAAAQTPRQREALERANDLSVAFQWATKTIAPSVVNIVSTQRIEAPRRGQRSDAEEFFERFFGRQFPEEPFYEARGQGSGVIVRPDGHILTNYHVVVEASEIRVTLANGRSYEARVVGTDRETDLAVVKIDADDLEPARFGDSDLCEVGQWVLAVGNPFGLDNTVTSGIISAKGRPAMGLSVYGNFIQTDAAINPGNSGGPLINLRGEVVGVNNAITTRTGGYMGIGFAIPSNMARSVLESLLETGIVVRGWLGVTMEFLSPDRAEELGYEGEGVLVKEVTESSPAARGGLRPDDIVTAVDGRAIRTMSQLQNSVARRPPGAVVEMTIFRNGRSRSVDVTLGERPPLAELLASQNGRQYFRTFGASVQELTADLAEELDLAVDEGVVIIAVEEDGYADRLGLRPRDVIGSFSGRRIEDLEDFRRAMDAFDPGGDVRIDLQRGGTRLSLIVE